METPETNWKRRGRGHQGDSFNQDTEKEWHTGLFGGVVNWGDTMLHFPLLECDIAVPYQRG